MKRILVAVDASPRGSLVLNASVTMAKLTSAKLVLLRAVGLPPELPRDFWGRPESDLIGMLLSDAKDDLAKLAQPLASEIVEATLTTVGTPWDVICREAKEREVDLVVIGSHGYSGLDRLLGTTAAKVVNHCDRNVLVIRMQLDGVR